jgi:hypothetical protein
VDRPNRGGARLGGLANGRNGAASSKREPRAGRATACLFGRWARPVCAEVSENWEGIVKLNHLNLTVSGTSETRRLFETHFGLTGLEAGVTRTATRCSKKAR